MADEFLVKVRQALANIADEISDEGSEFDFRYSLGRHLLEDALGWRRKKGEGHFVIEQSRKDVILFDDSDPPFPVIIIETKRPDHELDVGDTQQLQGYLGEVGGARYGMLTNGRQYTLYRYSYDSEKNVGTLGKPILNFVLPDSGAAFRLGSDLKTLDALSRDQFVAVAAPAFFKATHRQIPVASARHGDDEGYHLFVESLRVSLDQLQVTMERFFTEYQQRSGFIRDFLAGSYGEWLQWRQFQTEREEDEAIARRYFCRESAYVLMNRLLFGRILEDREIVKKPKLSGGGIATVLEDTGIGAPYFEAVRRSYREIENHYPHFYALGVFDWWLVSDDKRNLLSTHDKQVQADLERALDVTLGGTLKRMNRFNFRFVNRDVLGRVYEDYLPVSERKALGEFYTPAPVVRYMLDRIGYRPNEAIGDKKIIDPACGSGSFITEAAERLIQHYQKKFKRPYLDSLSPEQAKTVLERIRDNVYGLDINSFATNISEINLLFKTIDLYDIVRKKWPDYSLGRFNIYSADTLLPAPPATGEAGPASAPPKGQMTLRAFVEMNGRARAFVEEIDEASRIKRAMKFDFVVANPPYVQVRRLGPAKETYAAAFDTAVGNFDIYIPFLQRGLEWLTPDGRMAYIYPDRFLALDYATKSRGRLATVQVDEVLDFKEAPVFDTATPYPMILVLTNKKPPSNHVIKCARVISADERLLQKLEALKAWPMYQRLDNVEVFTFPQAALGEDIWALMPPDEWQVHQHITASTGGTTVGDASAKVFTGIQTSRDEVYVGTVQGDGPIVEFTPSGGEKSWPVEKKLLFKALKAKDLPKWFLWSRDLFLLFPYTDADGEWRPLTAIELAKFPEAEKFFGAHKERLVNRAGMDSYPDQYWAFPYPKNLDLMAKPKILTLRPAHGSTYAADKEGRYFVVGSGSVYGILLKPESATFADDYDYWVALLNSSSLDFVVKHIMPIWSGKFYSFEKQFLNRTPLPAAPTLALRKQIIDLAVTIRSRLTQAAVTERKLLTITTYLPPDLSPLLDISIEVNLKDDSFLLHSVKREGSRLILKRGQEILMPSDDAAEVARLILAEQPTARLTQPEILGLRVPRRHDAAAVLSKLSEDREQVALMRAEADTAAENLNEVVAMQLFGLKHADLEVIKRFLAIW